jgi:alpha-mannosidase II
LDQYKKKAMLYKTNTLLVPLGDDFRWENDAEWEAQMTNYQKIFDYINKITTGSLD